MKKRFLILLLAIVLLLSMTIAGVAHADAGNFSGGSDWGSSGGSSDWGGSSEWGDSSWDSGSGSSVNLGGLGFLSFLVRPSSVVVIIVILVVLGAIKNKRRQGYAPVRPPQPIMRPYSLDQLKAKDPLFSEAAFKEHASNLYVQMQDCWESKNWAPMRLHMTDALYSQFLRQLNELISANRTNHVERIAVLGVDILNYSFDEVNDIINLRIRTRIVDYTTDDRTGQIVSGSNTAEKFMEYEWTMIRSRDVRTPEQKENFTSVSCPHCGAPIAVSQSGQCEFCGSVITASEYDWVLSGVRGLSQRTAR